VSRPLTWKLTQIEVLVESEQHSREPTAHSSCPLACGAHAHDHHPPLVTYRPPPPPPEMQHPHSRAGSHAHQQAATHSGGRQRRSSRPQLVSHFGGPRWCLFVTGGRASERLRKAAAGTAAEKCSSWNATHATAPSCPKATRSSRPHLHYALYPRLRPLSPSGYRPSARLQHRVLVSVRA
jgi:hypothetical protein